MASRRVIGPHGGKSIISIGDRENSRQEWYCFSTQLVRITCSVARFVMVKNGIRDVRDLVARNGDENVVAASRVSPHYLQFFFIEPAGLEQDAIRNPDLAHIMQPCRQLQGGQLAGSQAARPAYLQGQAARTPTMIGCVVVALLKRPDDGCCFSNQGIHDTALELKAMEFAAPSMRCEAEFPNYPAYCRVTLTASTPASINEAELPSAATKRSRMVWPANDVRFTV